MTATPTPDDGAALATRINDYLGSGGLFNPELMEHAKVRDLLIEIRDYLTRSPAPVSGEAAERAAAEIMGRFAVHRSERNLREITAIRQHCAGAGRGGRACQQLPVNHNQPMFTLGNPQTHGTYNASNIYRDGDAVLSVPGIPLHTTLEELENKPHPAFQAALAFGKKVVAALNEAEQAGKL